MKNFSRPASRSSPLAMPMKVTSRGQVELGDDLAHGVELAGATVDEDDIGPVRHVAFVGLRRRARFRRRGG